MLNRVQIARAVAAAATLVLASTGTLVIWPIPASAQPSVNCPSSSPPFINNPANCHFGVDQPQIDAGPFHLDVPAGAARSNRCVREHGTDSNDPDLMNLHGPRDIPCSRDGRGQYSRGWDCYLLPLRDPPANGMYGYPEHAEDGTVYVASCFPPGNNPHGLSHWTADAHGGQNDPDASQWGGFGDNVVIPPGEDLDFDEGGPGLLELWIEALSSLEMHGPVVAMAPPVDSAGLVHLPVWMWTEDTGQTWPQQLAAAAPDPPSGPWLVEAWAEPQHIEWDMGDGRPPEQCGPGVAWGSGSDIFDPPENACRHTYLRPSRTELGGVFEIVALTTWRVWWHINGEFDNEVEIEVGTTATYQVNEVQVLTRR